MPRAGKTDCKSELHGFRVSSFQHYFVSINFCITFVTAGEVFKMVPGGEHGPQNRESGFEYHHHLRKKYEGLVAILTTFVLLC
jgi:hypothetical protein